MTDRYANGDPSNDRGGLTGSRSVTGFDPTGAGWFHGGDFAGLRGTCAGDADGLARIKALGFTSIWITPPFGQKTVQGDSAAYHGYWITDFTAPDPHLGTAPSSARWSSARTARPEGDPRRRRQPHRRRHLAHRRQRRLRRPGAGAVPDCRGKPFRPARVRREAVPVPERPVHAAGAGPARRRPDREEARLAERPDPLPRPGRHRLQLVQHRRAWSRATSSASTTCSPSGGTSSAASPTSTRPGSSATGSTGSGSTRPAT